MDSSPHQKNDDPMFGNERRDWMERLMKIRTRRACWGIFEKVDKKYKVFLISKVSSNLVIKLGF